MWNVEGKTLDVLQDGISTAVPTRILILATGATAWSRLLNKVGRSRPRLRAIRPGSRHLARARVLRSSSFSKGKSTMVAHKLIGVALDIAFGLIRQRRSAGGHGIGGRASYHQ